MSSATLRGRRIVVTRARGQASGFAALLRARGAQALVCPTIRIAPPSSRAALDRAVRGLETYDWLIFTSANAVEKFAARLGKRRFPPRLKTCAIGPVTARAMRAARFRVGKISKEYVAESILDEIPGVRGKRILIPRAAVARDVLPKELRRRGARVDVVEAYRTLPDRAGLSKLRRHLREGVDCVAFTSSSTVENFFAPLKAREIKALFASAAVAASIGPVTTGTLRKKGWPPAILARKPTTRHLALAIAEHYRKY